MDKRTRKELRRRCPTPEETDALLDMADERDRYRALLVEARGWVDGDKWKVTQLPRELVNLYLNLVERIDAALEGKNND